MRSFNPGKSLQCIFIYHERSLHIRS
ncbi:hypothetical protein JOF28_002067 [Leucobacter exalbidus]|uniref:Uncharacterized protein n=1 Tax=Leucobacter exalbidus TaxID=662960 RepID=A0A940T1F9_9MICO|nr:hypothetical protein [Leucobacter exalbidus]